MSQELTEISKAMVLGGVDIAVIESILDKRDKIVQIIAMYEAMEKSIQKLRKTNQRVGVDELRNARERLVALRKKLKRINIEITAIKGSVRIMKLLKEQEEQATV